jgi:hypothetical protein
MSKPPPRPIGPASVLNPDAGDHVVTAEPRELEAVRVAGEAVLLRYPYLRVRFPERADAFTSSDGAWLVQLCDRSAEQVEAQVHWLAQVLLHRGMPRRILEVYLHRLVDELERFVPERREEYAGLRRAGERLTEARRRAVPDAELEALAGAFEARAGEGPVPARCAGELVAAAVADEANGLPSLRPLLAWLGDPARTTPAWRGALRAIEAAARSVAARSDEPG